MSCEQAFYFYLLVSQDVLKKSCKNKYEQVTFCNNAEYISQYCLEKRWINKVDSVNL